MSTVVVLQCDLCGSAATNWMTTTAAEARSAAENEGWVRVGHKDYCSSCATSTEARLHQQRLSDGAQARRERATKASQSGRSKGAGS